MPERRRGCGYRKVGGLYLVTDGPGKFCDRLPIKLGVCPTCSAGFKHSLGYTWVDTPKLVGGAHAGCSETNCALCQSPESMGRSGLLWVGSRFYPTVRHFQQEAADMGISRRIQTVPHGFKLGQTWILLAHPRCIEASSGCVNCGGTVAIHLPGNPSCSKFIADGPHAGIFMLFRPTRIEMLVTESQSRDRDVIEKLERRGITPIVVPDDDTHHLGSLWEDLRSGLL